MMMLWAVLVGIGGVASAEELSLEGFLGGPAVLEEKAPAPVKTPLAELMDSAASPTPKELMIERSAQGPRLTASEASVKLVEYADEEGTVGLRRVRRVKDEAPAVFFAQAPTVHFGAVAAATYIPSVGGSSAPAARRSNAPAAAKISAPAQARAPRQVRSRTALTSANHRTAVAAQTAVRTAAPAAAPAQTVAPAAPAAPIAPASGGGSGSGMTAGQAPAAPRDMKDVNTNMIQYMCGEARCRPGGRPGETIVSYADGMTITHSYDQSQEYGFRNTYSYLDSDGHSFTLKGSPLVFDLTGRGVRASDRKLRYDIDGDGRGEVIHDISSGGGVLVFDADGDGVSGERGRELFGDNTDLDGDGRKDGYADGFEALNALVRRAVRERVLTEMVLQQKVLEGKDLAALDKAYGLKMRVGGLDKKAVSLKEAGVASITLSDEPSAQVLDFDGQGNDTTRRLGASFTRADGSIGSYEDVWFAFPHIRGMALAQR